MDQNALVSSGQALVQSLDAAGLRPRFAMWVHNMDPDKWKLWVVPASSATTKYEFYRQLSRVISTNRTKLGGLDASDVEIVPDSHPVVRGLKSFVRVPELAAVNFPGNSFNGYYLSDGIILRSDL
jgi:hypothetical protein